MLGFYQSDLILFRWLVELPKTRNCKGFVCEFLQNAHIALSGGYHASMGPVFRVRSKRFWRAKFPPRLSTKKNLEDRKRKSNAVVQALPFWCATATLNFWSRPASQLIGFCLLSRYVYIRNMVPKNGLFADLNRILVSDCFSSIPCPQALLRNVFQEESQLSCSVFLGVLLEAILSRPDSHAKGHYITRS